MKKILSFDKLYGKKTGKETTCKEKMVWVMICALSITAFTACKKGNSDNGVNNDPGQANTINTADGDTKENQTVQEGSNPATEETKETQNIEDYYPFWDNVVYRYEGEGNEYASYSIYTDYREDNRVQLRSSNGGGESIKVLEIKDGELRKVFSKGECYYRENLMDSTEDQGEIILKEPLTKGTEWMISENRRRYISNTDVAVSTPTGEYKTLEVTTEGDGNATLDYYARGVGLVKTIFTADGSTNITSSLNKIENNTPYKQNVRIFYPTANENIMSALDKEISFNTNDVTQVKLEEAIKDEISEEYDPLLGVNTNINNLYLNKDNVVYVDFSKELINDMNTGAAYENLILQCIANTLGTYYGVDKVYLTVEGEPYESGHIAMKKGETIEVDTSKVKK